MATLKVTAHAARDLPIMDRATGLADPYVSIRLDDRDHYTTIVRRTRHPEWNEDFRFDIPDLFVLQEDPLEVRVFDHDIISRDDIVGLVLIDCNSIMYQENPLISGWFPLYDTISGIRGEIRLTIRIKFHAATNPFVPCLPKRYTYRLFLSPSIESPGPSAEAPSGGSASTGMTYFPTTHVVLRLEQNMDPIAAMGVQHPTLAAEEEGVFIFSASRLDPSVFRVESARTMVEELLVKADPEHSRLTNLRSFRATNEARVIQLFKLSGKVRRQLSRKVVELKCNAVLGYVEAFDMEPNGIIVRAYGTPCVISAVKHVEKHELYDPRPLVTAATGAASFSTWVNLDAAPAKSTRCSTPSPSGSPEYANWDDSARLNNSIQAASVDATSSIMMAAAEAATVPTSASAGTTPKLRPGPAKTTPPMNIDASNSLPVAQPSATTLTTGSRTMVLLLTVKDLPSGCIQHIGGHLCARSVKIVSRVKSRQVISQERDAWWMELREELRANARAFHCNAILGYEEETQYLEDVVMLSLYGTAVMLDRALVPWRAGPEYLFRKAMESQEQKRSCAMVHLYHPNHRSRPMNDLSELVHHSMCNICHVKPVPEVLLASCALPVDLSCEGPCRLLQVTVTREKKDVKGVELAKVVSQALPFLEFSLHQQLLFKLRLHKLNACFGMRVSIILGPDAIIGTLTGTGCRLTGIPLRPLPDVQVVNPGIANQESVVRLKDLIAKHRRARRGRGNNRKSADQSGSSRSSSSSSGAGVSRRSSRHSTGSDSGSRSSSHSGSSASWLSTDSEGSDVDGLGRPTAEGSHGGLHAADFVIKIDDVDEAEMMLGMIDTKFEDSMMVTIPYIPESANVFDYQERVILNRRFSFLPDRSSSGAQGQNRISCTAMNDCLADAKRAFVQTVCRIAMRHPSPERLRVVDFRVDAFFEPNSKDLQLRLSGCLMVGGVNGRLVNIRYQDAAFRECVRNMVHGNVMNGLMIPHPLSSMALQDFEVQQWMMQLLLKLSQSGGGRATMSPHVSAVSVGEDNAGDATTTTWSSACGSSAGGAYMSFDHAGDESSSAAADGTTAKTGGTNHIRHNLLYTCQRRLFTTCNAPFTLPFVMDYGVAPLAGYDAPASAGGGTTLSSTQRPSTVTAPTIPINTDNNSGGGEHTYYRHPKRTTAFGRQWRSIVNSASSSVRNILDKVSEPFTKTASANLNAARDATFGAAGGKDGHLHHPLERLPCSLNALEEIIPTVLLTPLDYLSGYAVVRYLGRLSQHFIRESYNVTTAEELGVFFMRTEFEIHCQVQALVGVMGGNALLKHRITYHEVCDSDGSGNAFLFATITGDVVQVTQEPCAATQS